MRRVLRRLVPVAALALAPPVAAQQAAPFDLAGPALRVTVTRGGATLPIAEVPELATGDRLAIRTDLPADQSAHYVLVAAFLRGSTNPPPDKWFAQAEAWTKKGRRGLTLTVPDGAQQVAVFLAPATGGDFPTLRNAVQGRPGAFVRAAQGLAQASLDRARLDAFLRAVRRTVPGDPDRLERITPGLARSLAVKINPECLNREPDLQAPCLLQNQDSLVLSDGHSNAITDAVSGPGADLALQLSATPQGGLGYYSPYIAAIRDVIGIFGSIRTAKYQYIPALARLDGDRVDLVLNAAPSFHNPKSVLVAALPAIGPAHVPPLQIVEPVPPLCAQAPEQVLPVAGAPLIYATRYAHDLALRATLPAGDRVDLPVTADAERGGLVVRTDGKLPGDLAVPIDATLHGRWGFRDFDGPTVRLVAARAGQWKIAGTADDAATATLSGGAAACVAGVTVAGHPAEWKVAGPGEIAVALPETARRKGAAIEVSRPGGGAPDRLALAAPAPAPTLAVTAIARDLRRPPATAPVSVAFADDADVPADAKLTLSLRSAGGWRFTGRETIEVAAATGGTATIAPTLADPQIAVATIEPARSLGPSAFGPLRLRVVRDGNAGEWLPVGTLVRTPDLHQLTCPADPQATCELSGERLFLLGAVAATPDFAGAVAIPDGYPGNAIQVPHPVNGGLFVRLRDDPAALARIAG